MIYHHDSVRMQSTGKPNEYSAEITIPKLGTHVSYYLSVKDILAVCIPTRECPFESFQFFVGKDTIPPAIQTLPTQLS